MCVCECVSVCVSVCECVCVCVLTCCVMMLSSSGRVVYPCPGRFHCTHDEIMSCL